MDLDPAEPCTGSHEKFPIRCVVEIVRVQQRNGLDNFFGCKVDRRDSVGGGITYIEVAAVHGDDHVMGIITHRHGLHDLVGIPVKNGNAVAITVCDEGTSSNLDATHASS